MIGRKKDKGGKHSSGIRNMCKEVLLNIESSCEMLIIYGNFVFFDSFINLRIMQAICAKNIQ